MLGKRTGKGTHVFGYFVIDQNELQYLVHDENIILMERLKVCSFLLDYWRKLPGNARNKKITIGLSLTELC